MIETQAEIGMTDLAKRIDYGIRLAISKALAEHKRKGQSIFVWEDGKIVEIQPEDIQVPEVEEQEFI